MKLLLILWLFALASSDGPGDHLPETKDRLSAERMEQLVRQPIAVLSENGLAAGIAEFDRLLAETSQRHGSDSVQVADLTMAFGVRLYDQYSDNDDPELVRASAVYLKAAIPRYRAAFGPRSAEVAVALHSFADVLLVIEERPTVEAIAALEEALRIRLAALGPLNHETRATKETLVSVRAEFRRQ